MKRRVLRILGGVVVGLLLLGSLCAFVLYRRVSDAPSWYKVSTDPVAIDQAARSAEDKLVLTRNWAASVAAAEARATRGGSTKPSKTPPPAEEFTIRLTDVELTSFLMKWTKLQGWDKELKQYFEDPVIAVHDGKLVVAGKVADLGTVISLHFVPELSGDELRMKLDGVTGGKLPLPAAVARAQLEKLAKPLTVATDGWKAKAALDSRGQANSAMTLAAIGRFLLAMLQDQPVEPVGFLPVDDRRSVPVRITRLAIDENALVLTAKPLPPAERANVLTRLKN